MAWPIAHLYVAGQIYNEAQSDWRLGQRQYVFGPFDINSYLWGCLCPDLYRLEGNTRIKREHTHISKDTLAADADEEFHRRLMVFKARVRTEELARGEEQRRIREFEKRVGTMAARSVALKGKSWNIERYSFRLGYLGHLILDDYVEENGLMQSDAEKFAVDLRIRARRTIPVPYKLRRRFTTKLKWVGVVKKVSAGVGDLGLVEHLHRKGIQRKEAHESLDRFRSQMVGYIEKPYYASQEKLDTGAARDLMREHVLSGKVARYILENLDDYKI
ncbi:MAG: hypothetical protein ABH829_04985 [archaeon]